MTVYRKNVIQIEVSEFDYVVHTVGGEDLAVEAGFFIFDFA